MKKTKNKTLPNISSTERLQEMLNEAENELELIQPKIDKLESQLQKLKELKLSKQKLITLKLSIQSILSNFSDKKTSIVESLLPEKNFSSLMEDEEFSSRQNLTNTKHITLVTKKLKSHTPNGMFIPELAFQQVAEVLKRKNSINYDLFRAIVLNGGSASTEQIRQYLIENQIKQPASGEGFNGVELTDISARVSYLVRKGLVKPDGRGVFASCLGWAEPES